MIDNQVYISTFYGKGRCKVCGQERELRMGVCFECFEEALSGMSIAREALKEE